MSDSLEGMGYTKEDVEAASKKQAQETISSMTPELSQKGASDMTPADREQYMQAENMLGSTKKVFIEGKEVLCTVVDPVAEYQRLKANGGKEIELRKKVLTSVKEAGGTEKFGNVQDGTYYEAVKGDLILQNEGDKSEYIFGKPTEQTLEQRVAEFNSKYEFVKEVPADPGDKDQTPKKMYRKNATFKAIKVDRPITFKTDWGDMSVDVGGVLADQRYTIAASSMNGYEVVEDEKK